jgi:hypothetical protein
VSAHLRRNAGMLLREGGADVVVSGGRRVAEAEAYEAVRRAFLSKLAGDDNAATRARLVEAGGFSLALQLGLGRRLGVRVAAAAPPSQAPAPDAAAAAWAAALAAAGGGV